MNSEDTEEPGNNSEEESESQDQNETNDVDSSESSNESVENNSEEESSENNSQPVQSSDEDEQFEEPDDKPKQPVEQAPNSNNKTAVLTQQEENIWREERIEKIEIARPSNRMAVVALSLGLIITAMMLLFVGCRLRNVRKRLRKGRPMNSNEADYLINGMYL